MRLGIDARFLSQPVAGIARYASELTVALAAIPEVRGVLYTPLHVNVPAALANWEQRVVAPSNPVSRHSGYAWLRSDASRAIRADVMDAFWAPTTYVPRLDRETPILATVYDVTYKVAPQTMNYKSRIQYAALFERNLRAASRVATISHGTAAHLRTMFGVVADVIPPGVSARFRKPSNASMRRTLNRHHLSQPYLLAVGTREPRKNLIALLDAYEDLVESSRLRDTELVLAGGEGWRSRGLERRLQRSHVRVLGYVSDEDLCCLYAGSLAFVFPSLYEGFGMPVLEAKACGALVIASDTREVREAGRDGCIYVPPTVEGIRSGILEAVAHPPPATDIDRTQHDWGKSAAALYRALQEITCPTA